MQTLCNPHLTIAVSEHGAELTSLCDAAGHEYLWCADPAYWKRHSPVLFPIVGSVWQGVYRSHGCEYQLSQHGFARDMDFVLVSATDDEVWYRLESNEDTMLRYPYVFRLEIGYRLIENRVRVMWRVNNIGDEPMAFQIGAHPAFYWPEQVVKDTDVLAYFAMDTQETTLTRSVITDGGCVGDTAPVAIEVGGYLPLTFETFSRDAIVLENNQVHRVTLCRNDRTPYLTLEFSSPLVGLWSPPGRHAPFICIEPWWGRTDRTHYAGAYEDKEWIQHAAVGETFEVYYDIIVEK